MLGRRIDPLLSADHVGDLHQMIVYHVGEMIGRQPVGFEQDLRVTIQALGWRNDRRYLPLQDDISSVAYWYQILPSQQFPKLPDKDYLEII